MRWLDTWWSPAAQCWRIEDGEMFTYYSLAHVIGHLQGRDAGAQITAPPTPKAAELVRALQAAGILITYVEDV